MSSDLGFRCGHCDDGWTRTRRKAANREMLAMCVIPILREQCDRVGEAGVPISACVMQPIFNRVAEQHGMTRRFGHRWIYHFLRCAGFKYRVASGGSKKTTDPKLLDTHVDKLRLRLMYYVTEYNVHPSCIVNMDETAAKLLGLGQRGWARPKQDGRVRLIGAADKRNITISTVVTMTGTIMAQLIVEGATKRVVQDLPQHEKLSYTFSESHWCTESTCQELIEWLGAWVRKQGFLHWVLLWDCASVHRKASLLEWIRTAHPECHVLFIPGGYTAELQPADIAIQQPLKHSIKQQAMQFFAESVCRNEAVLDLRLSTMKRLLPPATVTPGRLLASPVSPHEGRTDWLQSSSTTTRWPAPGGLLCVVCCVLCVVCCVCVLCVVCVGVCWCVLVCVGVCSSVLVCVVSCVLVCVGVCVLVCVCVVGVCVCVCVCV